MTNSTWTAVWDHSLSLDVHRLEGRTVTLVSFSSPGLNKVCSTLMTWDNHRLLKPAPLCSAGLLIEWAIEDQVKDMTCNEIPHLCLAPLHSLSDLRGSPSCPSPHSAFQENSFPQGFVEPRTLKFLQGWWGRAELRGAWHIRLEKEEAGVDKSDGRPVQRLPQIHQHQCSLALVSSKNKARQWFSH